MNQNNYKKKRTKLTKARGSGLGTGTKMRRGLTCFVNPSAIPLANLE